MLSTIHLAAFITVWIFSAMLPVIVIVSVHFNNYYPLLLALCYYCYRLLYPAKSWAWMQSFVIKLGTAQPYFKSQKIIFDDNFGSETLLEIIPFERDSRTLLAFHPHGITSQGWGANGIAGILNDPVQGASITWLVTEALTLLPFISDLVGWYGCQNISKGNMERLMKDGKNVALLPGGFQEATLFQHHRHRVFIKNRKGFIKLALKHGYQVRPTYTFGEEETYWTPPSFLITLRLWLNEWKIPSVVFFGRILWPLLPICNVDMRTVVGPI